MCSMHNQRGMENSRMPFRGALRKSGPRDQDYCTVPCSRSTHYSAQLGALAPLIDWTSQMAGFWQSRFDHLEDLLKRMDQ